MPEQLRIVTKYETGDAVIMADLAGDGDVKRIQHYIFEELYLQGKLDLSDASTKGIKEFEIPINQAESYVDMQLNADVYSDGMGVFDLRAVPYHGGTTFSSGALPKWDIGDMFIKVCTLSPSGRWQTDAAHEAYAMDLFRNTGVVVADAVPGYALFYNKDTRQDEARFCEVARKFSGEVTYYRDLRDLQGYGLMNDQFIDFADSFNGAARGLLNMFAADYIMNQEDRHVKNFGVLDTGVFSPLYDNGASLHYATPDESLVYINGEVALFKASSKNPLQLLTQYADWFDTEPDIDFGRVLANLDVIERKYSGLLSKARLKHNRRIVERRVAECLEIFA